METSCDWATRVNSSSDIAQIETDAVVSIRREGGEIVLDTLVDGPFLLVNVPPGHYIVTAQKKSEPMHRTVKIDPKSSQRVIFEWKD